MADGPTAVYWDSCVIIHRIQKTPAHINILEYLINEAENNRLLIVVSTFTIAEVVKIDSVPPLTEEQDKLISDYFDNDYIVIRPLTIPIARLAREISRKHNIKPKDAVHVATAVFWKVPLLHTYDNNLCKKTGLIGDPPLKIENPSYVNQVPLFPILSALTAPVPSMSELLSLTNTTASQQGESVTEPSEPASATALMLTEADMSEPPIQGEGRKIMFAEDDTEDAETIPVSEPKEESTKIDDKNNSTIE